MREPALQILVRAIASRDQPAALRLIAGSPQLAQQAIGMGATRAAASGYFFEEIAHYAYAGDTPLHMAAAAYQAGIARELVANGANVSARNRRGAEPLHYAADGVPGSPAWDPDAGSAASREEQTKIIRLLLDRGARPSDNDAAGRSVKDCVRADWIHALLEAR
jgi:hypothetical protein